MEKEFSSGNAPLEEEGEALLRSKEKREELSRIRTEEEYVRDAVARATRGGWVKKEQEKDLVDQYLKPIHQTYREIIDDLKKENGLSAEDISDIIMFLNTALESTHRIGVTDPQNIMRAIHDVRDRYKRSGYFGHRTGEYHISYEYALGLFSRRVSEVLDG